MPSRRSQRVAQNVNGRYEYHWVSDGSVNTRAQGLHQPEFAVSDLRGKIPQNDARCVPKTPNHAGNLHTEVLESSGRRRYECSVLLYYFCSKTVIRTGRNTALTIPMRGSSLVLLNGSTIDHYLYLAW